MNNKNKLQTRAWLSGLNLGLMVLSLIAGIGTGINPGLVAAAATGSVVINEVAWAGSVNSANDEWIELYNLEATPADLSAWKLRYNGADLYTFPAGASIAANSYFLIERTENAVSNITADVVVSMSLVNTGASLELVDSLGSSIDKVNSTKAAWFAGSSTSHASMERRDVTISGDLASNWISSVGSGALASAGGAIVGTPKAVNSGVIVSSGVAVKMVLSNSKPLTGEVVKLLVNAENVTDLFDYGVELNYDPTVLQLQNVVKGDFLGQTGTISTSFQSGLKANLAGNLLVAEARTTDSKVGRSGTGELFEVNFKVIGADNAVGTIGFVNGSFVASATADLVAAWQGASLAIGSNVVLPISGLKFAEGDVRYQIKLNWDASASAIDHYRIERKDVHGNWIVLGGITGTQFVDQDAVVGGGKIIPNWSYQYRIIAVKGTVLSDAVQVVAIDSRGIKGDNNRSDLVDGRDLEKLAKGFSLTDTQAGFDALVDTTYDGRIDGSDLIDIGASFAQKY